MKKINQLLSREFERLLWFIIIILTWFFTGTYVRNKDMYQAGLMGTIEYLEYNDRDETYAGVKFKNTPSVNVLTGLHDSKLSNPNYLKKGDSLYKPMFSNKCYIYRKDSIDNEYKLIDSIKNE